MASPAARDPRERYKEPCHEKQAPRSAARRALSDAHADCLGLEVVVQHLVTHLPSPAGLLVAAERQRLVPLQTEHDECDPGARRAHLGHEEAAAGAEGTSAAGDDSHELLASG